jgi:hypothetical protein
MPYIVNSAPGAGLRFESSVTVADAPAALDWAAGLAKRGMRLIRIKDTITGKVYDATDLRNEMRRAKEAQGT